MKGRKPLAGRPDLIVEAPEKNALARDLSQLVRKHGLSGAVLVSFTSERVGVNSSGTPDLFGVFMEKLGDQILAAISDGEFDPDPSLAASIGLPPGRA